MWYSWPPYSHTVATLVTMPATWITKAHCRQGVENNDGHDSNMEASWPLHEGTHKDTETLKMDVGTYTHAHKHIWVDAYTIGQWNPLQNPSLPWLVKNTPSIPPPFPASPLPMCVQRGLHRCKNTRWSALLMQFSRPGFTRVGSE